MYNYTTKSGIECHTVYDMIKVDDLYSGRVRIDDEICSGNTAEWMGELDWIKNNVEGTVCIELLSNGGDVYGAFALYDMIKSMNKPEIVARGVCASAAAMIILQAGATRKALPNTRFLLHEPSNWIEGKKSSLEDELNELKLLSDKIVDILSDRCGKSREDVKALIDRKEVWMSAEEALAWGLIDEIV